MIVDIEFYFDFLSPYSYLAYRILHKHLTQFNLIFKPVSLPHIIKMSGNAPPANLKARANYLQKDLQRSAQFYGIELRVPEKFPFDTRKQIYELIEMIEVEKKSFKEIDDFIMRTWIKIFENGELEDTLTHKNKNYDNLKALILKNTQEALDLGAYGVPFWCIKKRTETGEIVECETFFGSDRFHHIAKFIGIDSTIFYSSKL